MLKLERDIEIKRWSKNIEILEYKDTIKHNDGSKKLFFSFIGKLS